MATSTTTTDRTKVLAGAGSLFTGSFGATEPADTAVNVTPPSSSWTPAGPTDGGLTVTVNQTFFGMRVDQNPDIVGRRLTERDVQVSTNLAETTLTNWNLALNDTTSSSGAGFSAIVIANGQSAMFPTERAVIVDGNAPGTNKNRRVIVRRVVSIESVANSFAKDGLQLFPVTFGGMFVSSTIEPLKVVDEV